MYFEKHREASKSAVIKAGASGAAPNEENKQAAAATSGVSGGS